MSSAPGSSAERYVLKDFRGSSHRILARWMADLPSGCRVLELGPGLGHLARLVRREDLRWVGLEGSIDCLGALAEGLSGGAILDLDHVVRLPRSFDAVVAGDTLEHLANPRRVLELVRECLPPGGRLLLSVPNVANVHVRLNLLLGRFPYSDRGILDRTHVTFFTASSLLEMLDEAGFVTERWTTSTIPLRLALPWLPRPLLTLADWALLLTTRLLPRLFGYQVIVAARRA